jgi:hypothetical protein
MRGTPSVAQLGPMADGLTMDQRAARGSGGQCPGHGNFAIDGPTTPGKGSQGGAHRIGFQVLHPRA